MAALSKDAKVNEVIDNLVLTAMATSAELGGEAQSANQVTTAIEQCFKVSLKIQAVQAALDRHVQFGRLQRYRRAKTKGIEATVYVLPPEVREERESRLKEAFELEERVRLEWVDSLPDALSDEHSQALWECLRSYMTKAFYRHGAETVALLSPESGDTLLDGSSLSEYLNEAIYESCDPKIADEVRAAVQGFFQFSTPVRTRYVTQLLDATFTMFALSVDAATSTYLKASLRPLRLFLDTNFLFALLDLSNGPLDDIAKELFDFIRGYEFPFVLHCHEDTLNELRRTIHSAEERLAGKIWAQDLSRAAVESGKFDGIVLRYHSANAQSPISPEVFFSKFSDLPTLLTSRGIEIYCDHAPRGQSVEKRGELVAEYTAFLEKYRPERPKGYHTLDHDISVWMAVSRLSRRTASSVLDAEALFLSNDYYFRRFEWQSLRAKYAPGLVILPNHLLQLLRAYVPSSEDFDRRFIEVFAIPELRTVGGDYRDTASDVLAYMNHYRDLPKATAIRILTNKVLSQQIAAVDRESDEFAALIDTSVAEANRELEDRSNRLASEKEAAVRRAIESENAQQHTEQELQNAKTHIQKLQEGLARAMDAHESADKRLTDTEARIETMRREFQTKLDAEESDRREAEEADEKARREGERREMIKGAWLVVVFTILFGAVLYMSVPNLKWGWLDNHPNNLGLLICSHVTLTGIAASLLIPRHRVWFVTAVVLAVILVFIQIVGKGWGPADKVPTDIHAASSTPSGHSKGRKNDIPSAPPTTEASKHEKTSSR
jgi:hypothetical protein